MTITLFITVFTAGAAVTSLLTEAIKKAYQNANKDYSANMIALINALVVGGGGTAVTYMLSGIEWTVNNVICLVLMIVATWIGSMCGYDKVLQLLSQLANISTDESSTDTTTETTDTTETVTDSTTEE